MAESTADGTGEPATGSGDGASSEQTQSVAPADLRAGLALQTGSPIKISVQGISGTSLNSGRSLNDMMSSVHVLSAEVRSIGGTLLPNQAVNVYSLDTAALVGSGTTDANGLLTMNVPTENNYRIEIVDEGLGAGTGEDLVGLEDDEAYRVVARFLDGSGNPLVAENIDISDGTETNSRSTDETGAIDFAGALQPYDLTVRGQTFTVHALLSTDHDNSEDNASIFIIGGDSAGGASPSGDSAGGGSTSGDSEVA